ncbi:monocarboxylate transporter 5-like isoform X6 [Mytilus californianus]|uniref:monocarboxylate transporter 5-like isoform X6 n=1 Tax=Mytilus californianus TaxID=6549 RepID=UPI002245A8BD|nr:monocarboxylate transporter 5-like isoform X6 [Mytilus californianus]
MNMKEALNSIPRRSEKDTGWAWIISLGATLHVFILLGTAKSLGLFFVEFLWFYDTNSSILSGMLAAQTLTVSLSSLFVLNIGSKLLGNRKLIIIGGFISFSGYLLSAFSPNIAVLVLSQSVLYGVGCACTTGPVFVVLNYYFEKHLGFANSFAYVGGSVGSLAWPVIIRKLLDNYGLQGALLVVSGLILNNIIVGALMRPFLSEPVVEKQDVDSESEADIIITKRNWLKDEISISLDNVPGYFSRQKYQVEDQEPFMDLIDKRVDIKRSLSYNFFLDKKENEKTKIKIPEKSDYLVERFTGSNINIDGSLGTPETFWTTHICSLRSLPQHTPEESSTESNKNKSEFCFNQYIIDMTVLRNRKLQLFLFVSFFSFCGSGMIITFIPPFARDNGISNDRITILITIIGGCDLFARFTLAWITDSQKIRRHHIMGFCLGITGVASMLNPLYTNFTAFIGYSVIYGLFGSIYFSMSILVLRDCVGAENISAAISLMITIQGLSSIIIAPSVGFIRDTTGSYAGSFFLMGSGLILGSVGIFCQPLVN